MAADRSTAMPTGGRKPNWELPAISGVEVVQKAFKPQKMRNFESPLPSVPSAMSIVVTLTEPIPVRAMPPVLHVGDTILTESEAVDAEGLSLRFWMFEPDQVKAGAPITLAWMGDKPVQKKSKFAYHKPE